jgi:hypothetical protein
MDFKRQIRFQFLIEMDVKRAAKVAALFFTLLNSKIEYTIIPLNLPIIRNRHPELV